jgi:hypothetical protein
MSCESRRIKHAVSGDLDGLFDAALNNLAGWARRQLADARRLQALVAVQRRRLRRLGARAVAA